MGKNAKRRRDAYYHERAQYVRIVQEAVRAILPRLVQLAPPVVDFHLTSPFGPEPDGHTVFYVVADSTDLDEARSSHLAEQLLAATKAELQCRHYPASGVESLTVRVIAQTDIDQAGGSFAYFR